MKLFRYCDVLFTNGLHLILMDWEVVSETPKGYWIQFGYEKRWVSKTSRKRFAHVTPEDAWKSFQARKARQIEICKAHLSRALLAAKLTRDLDAPPLRNLSEFTFA